MASATAMSGMVGPDVRARPSCGVRPVLNSSVNVSGQGQLRKCSIFAAGNDRSAADCRAAKSGGRMSGRRRPAARVLVGAVRSSVGQRGVMEEDGVLLPEWPAPVALPVREVIAGLICDWIRCAICR